MLFGSGNALWVTKLRIDSVHVLTEKIPPGGGGLPYICLIGIGLKWGRDSESRTAHSHYPMRHEFPGIPSREETRRYFINWARRRQKYRHK